jgi:uncharacterized protein YlxW (UPF0749 family)
MALLRDLMRDDVGLEYAEAAQHRRDRGVGKPFPRWVTALTGVAVAGVLVLGLVQRQAEAPQALAAREALTARAVVAEERVSALEADVATARSELLATEDQLLAQSAEGDELATRIRTLEEVTGYLAVTGPGLVLVLDDAAAVDPADPAAPGRVRDRDVQAAVNGLWQAGAEAIAINGRRLTATTAIRTAGEAILVDFKPLLPPYRIEAVGDPATLPDAYAATRSAQLLTALVEAYGLRISSEPATSLTLPSATALLPVRALVPSVDRATVAPSASTTGGQP